MNLYYTTSTGHEEAQTRPSRSLGGFRSSTLVKNDDFDNAFGEISPYTVRENRDEYIAVMLKNETGADVSNIELWIDVPTTSYTTYQIAVVTTVDDFEGNPKIERIRDKYSRPFVGNFVDTANDNRANIPSLANDAELGVWIKRSLNLTVINQDQDNIYERDPDNVNLFRKIELSKSDSIVFNLSWP